MDEDELRQVEPKMDDHGLKCLRVTLQKRADQDQEGVVDRYKGEDKGEESGKKGRGDVGTDAEAGSHETEGMAQGICVSMEALESINGYNGYIYNCKGRGA
eukprot:768431-Hanusia_phi.AAC.22